MTLEKHHKRKMASTCMNQKRYCNFLAYQKKMKRFFCCILSESTIMHMKKTEEVMRNSKITINSQNETYIDYGIPLICKSEKKWTNSFYLLFFLSAKQKNF